ncbi:DUF397 domain-containing protein [Streptomyces sp. MBT65]|uniref:DUF397 domain-containing protein n=1 Tax=Streptomyces sp. MBT65 TaxID=1488395 RepID=UPI0019097D52|nr:DUF397 domain-containing protein [Streptomyces sp. MBT65]MBK3578508.1 DUF397 domain-containing protein [Streptomyces sp. MBT65]
MAKKSARCSRGLEVALEQARPTVHVRDSKAKSGPALAFSSGEWAAFVGFVAGK